MPKQHHFLNTRLDQGRSFFLSFFSLGGQQRELVASGAECMQCGVVVRAVAEAQVRAFSVSLDGLCAPLCPIELRTICKID